uniref:2-amino-1-hydroxyethylphosphonate dioxygenase (glycine-forming)-like n=1 Tax=Styela clava TaxID=7725 RepID=UPI00193A9005|nr:2-amino-1-hydroxyethylphosphonate dioxygenase (glycine-forming)-like [Styela clava]
MRFEDIERLVEDVFEKYEKYANVKYDGEEITLLEHSLQIAKLAEEHGASEEVILGAFFHDIGHVLEVEQSHMPEENWKYIVGKHNETGHQFLIENNFPHSIASPAKYHVNAKRYLVCRVKEYHDGLSECSKRTLIGQGGPMSEKEAREFEQLPYFQTAVNVRKWDDKAKVIGQTTPTLEKYKSMCLDYLVQIMK